MAGLVIFRFFRSDSQVGPLMQEPQQRASRLRLVALASTVALAVALPLAAATAGQEAHLSSRSTGEPSAKLSEGRSPQSAGAQAPSSSSPSSSSSSVRPGAADRGKGAGSREKSTDKRSSLSRQGLPELSGSRAEHRPAASCGPEVASPEGVEAQTCVLTESGETWARTYYRNATNSPLRAVLSLLRPDGRTTQVHCRLPAADEPGLCETPRRQTRKAAAGAGASGVGESVTGSDGERERAHAVYEAVAEIAPQDSGRRLLRAGSNSPGTPRS